MTILDRGRVLQGLRAMRSMVLCAPLVLACGRGRSDDAARAGDQATESARQAATALPRTIADFQALRYLEGDWRGSGYAGGPFYESYRFVDDSTIAMTAWSDSTLSAAREQSRYLLRDGVIRTDDGARLVRVDSEGHHFQRGSSSWAFRQVSPDRWTARVGPSSIYTMDRIGRR